VRVTVSSTAEDVLWSRSLGGTPSSFTAEACQSDEVRLQVIAALTEALHQAQGQLGSFEVVNAVADIGSAASKVDCYIPVTVMRHDDSRRQHAEKSAVGSMLAAGLEGLKIGVIRKPHVALVTALNDDDVPIP